MLVIEIALGVASGILLAAGLRKLLPRVQWRRIADRMYGLPTWTYRELRRNESAIQSSAEMRNSPTGRNSRRFPPSKRLGDKSCKATMARRHSEATSKV
jgi:hypothetical protein